MAMLPLCPEYCICSKCGDDEQEMKVPIGQLLTQANYVRGTYTSKRKRELSDDDDDSSSPEKEKEKKIPIGLFFTQQGQKSNLRPVH
jgi:hypothetical protein